MDLLNKNLGNFLGIKIHLKDFYLYNPFRFIKLPTSADIINKSIQKITLELKIGNYNYVMKNSIEVGYENILSLDINIKNIQRAFSSFRNPKFRLFYEIFWTKDNIITTISSLTSVSENIRDNKLRAIIYHNKAIYEELIRNDLNNIKDWEEALKNWKELINSKSFKSDIQEIINKIGSIDLKNKRIESIIEELQYIILNINSIFANYYLKINREDLFYKHIEIIIISNFKENIIKNILTDLINKLLQKKIDNISKLDDLIDKIIIEVNKINENNSKIKEIFNKDEIFNNFFSFYYEFYYEKLKEIIYKPIIVNSQKEALSLFNEILALKKFLLYFPLANNICEDIKSYIKSKESFLYGEVAEKVCFFHENTIKIEKDGYKCKFCNSNLEWEIMPFYKISSINLDIRDEIKWETLYIILPYCKKCNGLMRLFSTFYFTIITGFIYGILTANYNLVLLSFCIHLLLSFYIELSKSNLKKNNFFKERIDIVKLLLKHQYKKGEKPLEIEIENIRKRELKEFLSSLKLPFIIEKDILYEISNGTIKTKGEIMLYLMFYKIFPP